MDFAWILGLSGVGLFAIPLVGGPILAILALVWRSRGVTPDVAQALPPCRAPLPPVRTTRGMETWISLGLCLLVGAPLLLLFPPLGILLLGLAAWIVWSAWKEVPLDAAAQAARARVEIALDVAYKALETREFSDEVLGLQGELQRLEADWRSATDADRAIDQLERLLVRISGHPGVESQSTQRVLEALRRSESEDE